MTLQLEVSNGTCSIAGVEGSDEYAKKLVGKTLRIDQVGGGASLGGKFKITMPKFRASKTGAPRVVDPNPQLTLFSGNGAFSAAWNPRSVG